MEYGALNFADLYTRKGFMPNKKAPFILGIECTGVVTKIGNIKNSKFKVSAFVFRFSRRNKRIYFR